MIVRPTQPKKRQELPTTNELQFLINNLKLSKPLITQINNSNEITDKTIIMKSSDNKTQFQSVIEDDFSNYKCFQEIERQYHQECLKKTQEFKYENKVILKSPIYRLSEDQLLEASNFKREMTQKPNKKEKTLFQSTVSSKNKDNRVVNKSKEIKIRRQLFTDKENCCSQNLVTQKIYKREVQSDIGKIKQLHKFSNPQNFLKEKKK